MRSGKRILTVSGFSKSPIEHHSQHCSQIGSCKRSKCSACTAKKNEILSYQEDTNESNAFQYKAGIRFERNDLGLSIRPCPSSVNKACSNCSHFNPLLNRIMYAILLATYSMSLFVFSTPV